MIWPERNSVWDMRLGPQDMARASLMAQLDPPAGRPKPRPLVVQNHPRFRQLEQHFV